MFENTVSCYVLKVKGVVIDLHNGINLWEIKATLIYIKVAVIESMLWCDV